MKKIILAIVTIALSCTCLAQGSNLVVSVEGGMIQGTLSADPQIAVFKGIPYAAAPVGELRWKRPQPVIPWEGVMMADKFKKICPQVLTRPIESYPEKYRSLYTEHDEDCLFVNVWTPAGVVGTDAKLPVMFWIHGGAYNTGSGITASTDGDAWARKGVIVVTINYRLNILGFLCHPALTDEAGRSGNYGIYDQIAALKWTYENIAKFGGDPDNITIAGQSAGGMSVKNLVISPLAKPYIAKAIIQSGGGLDEMMRGPTTQAELDNAGKTYMESGEFSSIEEMRGASYSDIISRCKARFQGAPFADGVVLTKSFSQAVNDKEIADIPYLMGYNDGDMASMIGDVVPAFCRALKQINKNPVYQYEFRRNAGGGKAPHSAELNYMFYTLDRGRREVPPVDYELSEQMVTYWTNFCKYGNPNGPRGKRPWHPYTEKDPFLMILDVAK